MAGDPLAPYDPIIAQAAQENGLDPAFLRGILRQESNGDPRAVSKAGAMGLGQLMPATAQQLGVQDPFDPEQNIHGAARYLSEIHQQLDAQGLGDWGNVAAAYNAGPGAVLKARGVPAIKETQEYVPRVLGYAQQYGMRPDDPGSTGAAPPERSVLNGMVPGPLDAMARAMLGPIPGIDDPSGPAVATPAPPPSQPAPTVGNGLLYLDSQGHFHQIDPAQAQEAATAGMVPATPEQRDAFAQQQAVHQKYGGLGGQLAAAGAAAARTASFGLSDLALTRSGAVSPDTLRALEQENPIASGLGTTAGIVAPSLLSGGASAAGKVADLTAPALITRMSQGAQGALAKALDLGAATGVSRVAKQALVTGAGSALESAAYAGGHVVSEAALGDPGLTAEGVAAQVGLSGLLGFGVGAAASGVWNVGKEALGGVRLSDQLAPMLRDVEGKAALSSTGGVTRGEVKKLARTKGGTDNVLQIGREARELGLVPPGARPADILGKANDLMDKLSPTFEATINEVDSKLLADEAPSMARIIISFADDPFIRELGTDPLQSSAQGKLTAVIDKYAGQYGVDTGGMSFRDLFSLRKQIDRQLYGVRGGMDPDRNVLMQGLHTLRSKVNGEINATIGNATKVPSEVLNEWKSMNRQWEVAATIRDLAQTGMERRAGNLGFSLTDQIAGGAGLAGGLASDMLHGNLYGAASMLGHRAVREYGSGIVSHLAGGAASALEGGALQGLSMGGAGEALAGSIGSLTAGAASSLIRGAVASGALTSLVNNTGTMLASGREGSPDGLAPGLGDADTIANSPEKVAVLAHLERMNGVLKNQIDAGVNGAVRGSRSDQTSRGESIPGIQSAFARDSDDAQSQFQKRVQFLNDLQQDPQKLVKLLTEQTDGWHPYAPTIATALTASTSRGVAYLQSHVPQPPQQQGLLDGPYQPSPMEIAGFNHVWEAVNRPLSILKQAATGTLVPESVDAVQQVYPRLYAELRMAAVAKLSGAPNAVPYQNRLALSTLLGMPLDGSASDTALASNQGAYARASASEQMQQQQASSASKKSGTPTQSKRMLTDQQQAASRGEEKV